MLLFGVAKMMHLPPDVVREMSVEDVIGLAAAAGIEADETRKASKGSQAPSGKVSRLKKR